ncbi:MAG TPA: thiamine phosphate synthase [Acidobacteriota bacterium]|nr:thiamine phosphate synthase [Acidobacteriota bacterium]
MSRFQLGPLYPLTHRGWGPPQRHLEQAQLFLRSGIRFFQVREKDLSDRELTETLRGVARLAESFGAGWVVNDRPDLALEAGASGVHLGQQDLPVAAARRLLGPGSVVGISTHTFEEFQAACAENVDYIAVGPIFPSSTKAAERQPVGVRRLSRWRRLTSLPLVAIGGITLQRAPAVWNAGANAVAVISDIVCQPDPGMQIRRYLERSGA